MKAHAVLFAILIAAAALPAAAQPAVPDKFAAPAGDVQALIAKAKAEHKGDDTNTTETLVSIKGYRTALEYRTGTTPPTIHPGASELIYVVDGNCTFLQGGKLDGRKDARPGAMTVFGTGITGGAPRKLSKGDYILVPPNTAHQFTQVSKPFVIVSLHLPAQ